MILSQLTRPAAPFKLTAQSNSLCELFLGRVDDQMVAKHVQCLVCVCVWVGGVGWGWGEGGGGGVKYCRLGYTGDSHLLQ